MTKKQYDLVQNDEYDCRIPLHNDEAFQHGISFQAKYIGTLDVPRPSSRVEIVAAMRRIRYEYKAKSLKKKKVSIVVSTEGVKVILKKKRRKKNQYFDNSKLLIMHHPIYRIFYVSHDSQDLKIFSYIARESHSNVFKCSVFKAQKKSVAMRVVRTIGQAFEVCHKLECGDDGEPVPSLDGSLETAMRRAADACSDPLSMDLPPYDSADPLRPLSLPPLPAELLSSPLPELPLDEDSPLAAHHERQLLREQLLQQRETANAALAQVRLLRGTLAAETAARVEAQTRTHQLLLQNRQLLTHIAQLVRQLRLGDPEPAATGSRSPSPEEAPPADVETGASAASSLDAGLGSSSVSAAAVSDGATGGGLLSRLTRGAWARHTTA